jgi:hypothetical protein
MGRRNKDDGQPLAEYWKPPEGVGAPISCIATTFEFQAGFFETELLPRFLGLRFDHTENERTFIVEREEALATTRACVLVDISKFDPQQTTLQWDQLPIQLPNGIQHGKLTILVWEGLVRLIVTSANLTRQGYRRNRELFAALDFFDGPTSVPLKPLIDALEFIEIVSSWSRALPAAIQRVGETVEQVRERMRRWSSAPQDFSPRERPRVNLVAGHPDNQIRPARSVMEQILHLWGQRRAHSLTVITPFAGQDAKNDVISRIRNLPMSRGARGWLVVPEVQTPEGSLHRIVPMPEHLGQNWKKRFGKEAYVLPAPLYVEGFDDRPRELHTKAMLIQGNPYDLLMIGSSNFTPHGMGVGAINCEVNLAFEDRANAKYDGLALEGRLGLPVTLDSAVSVDDVVWQQPDLAPEDAPPSKPYLPAFFAWASYSQKTGEIRVVLDRSQWEPAAWTICLAGQVSEHSAILFSSALSPSKDLSLSFTLDEKSRGAHLTALSVCWQDKAGAQYEGFIAISVEDSKTDLLPPEEFRNLTVESIIECLLSGREPAEWVERQTPMHKGAPSTNTAIDSLRSVDTSNYLLYRVRLFGRALTAMSNRIRNTVPTSDAISYRLLRDPLGPISLAEALCSNGNGHNSCAAPTETGFQLYALAEIVLSLGHVGHHIISEHDRDSKWIASLFLEACEILGTKVQKIRELVGALPDDLDGYLNTVFAENARLSAHTRRNGSAG